jgi:hypothetical protein
VVTGSFLAATLILSTGVGTLIPSQARADEECGQDSLAIIGDDGTCDAFVWTGRCWVDDDVEAIRCYAEGQLVATDPAWSPTSGAPRRATDIALRRRRHGMVDAEARDVHPERTQSIMGRSV